MRIKKRFIAGCMVLSALYALGAEMKNEVLLQTVPKGYKIDFQTQKENMQMVEMVPQNESVQNWTEMVTTQIFQGLKLTPDAFQERMKKLWASSCPDSAFVPIKEGKENGYAFKFWINVCARNPATNQPEITWFKAIQGTENFYVVQKAFKYMPKDEIALVWTDYLESIKVCDTRIKGRECPKK